MFGSQDDDVREESKTPPEGDWLHLRGLVGHVHARPPLLPSFSFDKCLMLTLTVLLLTAVEIPITCGLPTFHLTLYTRIPVCHWNLRNYTLV